MRFDLGLRLILAACLAFKMGDHLGDRGGLVSASRIVLHV